MASITSARRWCAAHDVLTIWMGLFAVLSLLDYLSTVWAMHLGFLEMNLLFRWLFTYGNGVVFLGKLLQVLVIYAIIVRLARDFPKLAGVGLGIAITLVGGVVFLNLLQVALWIAMV